MTEVSFAKQFLTSIDSRPVRLSSDHVEDPRNHPARNPYTLPKMPRPMTKKQTLAPGQEPTIKISIKALRSPTSNLSLPPRPISTSVLEIKQALAERSGVSTEKIRVLYQKKPCSDTKTIKELVRPGDREVEFNVMFMGAPTVPPSVSAEAKRSDNVVESSVAQGPSGETLLQTDAFWDDLRAYLTQRLRDEAEGEKVYQVFRKAWETQR
ncbi:MAG: hypothetical protein M1817_003706 [Caeruleum heppii]|nr:MAG: hypothetical protein M1817_003706 [Caeruleum heppii]